MTYRETLAYLADLIDRLDLAPRYVTVSAHTPPTPGAGTHYAVYLLISAPELSRVSKSLGERIEEVRDEMTPGPGWLSLKSWQPWGLVEFSHHPAGRFHGVST